MKTSKFFFAAMMAAAVAVGFTACEPKTPENPFEKPGDGDGDGKDTTTVVVGDAITCAEAITKTEGETLKVVGYVTFAYDYNASYGDQSAWLADDATSTQGVLQAYNCKTSTAVKKGDKVCVEGPLKLFKKNDGTVVYEIEKGTMSILEAAPEEDTSAGFALIDKANAISCAEAATQMGNGTKVTVKGYAISAQKEWAISNGQQAVYLADNADATESQFCAYWCYVDQQNPIAKGDLVYVYGEIIEYNKQPEIKNGYMTK